MKRLTVFAHDSDADAIVRRLMSLRCVQIRRSTPELEALSLERLETDRQRAESEARVALIGEVIPALAKYSSRKRGLRRRLQRVDRERFTADGKAEVALRTAEQARELLLSRKQLTEEQARVDALMQSLIPWLDYDAPLDVGHSAKTVTVLGNYAGKIAPDAELEACGAYVEAVSEDENGRYLAVTYHLDDEEVVERVLSSCGFVKTSFPEIHETAQAAYDRAERHRAELDESDRNTSDRLMLLSDALDDLEILFDIEQTTVNVCLQKQKLFRTQYCLLLEGWVPSDRSDAVVEALSAFECACELAPPEEGEEPPVLLRNGSFSSTFEWVIGMYSYPKYGTYDPTVVMSIFYFLIFGMMFADVGYGLLLVLGCFGGVKFLNPKPGMKQMLLMFGYCGISCMLMGVLFGGWFGDLPTAIMDSFIYHQDGVAQTTPIGSFFYNGLIFNPVESSIGFLFLALGMGEIHLIAGMAIGMVQTWKSGKRLQALGTTVPFWVLFAGIDLMVPSVAVGMISNDPPDAGTTELFANLSDLGFCLLLAGLVLILLLNGVGQKNVFAWLMKGLSGLYSLISFASDLLSYSRILALGLVASVIASVINMLTGLGSTGPVGFVFMLLVMLLGHALNLAINLLGTFVHAARLQYIEFFGKFYEDGGEPFTPALPSEEYSEDVLNVPNINP